MVREKETVKETVKKTILEKELIQQGAHIVIGLSGGPDSVCLFHVLYNLREELGFSMYAVHVNHRFRPGAAEEDQAFVNALCRDYGIPCFNVTCDCGKWAKEHGVTAEEAGRRIRYDAFVNAARKLNASGIPLEQTGIAVAQNGQDQAETVLFRFLRGTGTDGLAGMAYERKEQGVRVIRPLLDVDRAEIEAYCSAHQLNPRIDHTNLEPVYTRNKIRLELIPYLQEQYNENIIKTVNRLSKIAGEDKEYLWKQAMQAYEAARTGTDTLDLDRLREMEAAIRHRVIMHAFHEAGLTEDITEAHLAAADRALQRPQTSKTTLFPRGYEMTIRYDKVFFGIPKHAESIPPRMEKMELKIQVLAQGQTPPQGSAVFDWDKIRQEYPDPQIVLRGRKAGDFIRFKHGSKKLQNFFVDEKIPAQERQNVPLVAIGSEVLWMAARPETPLTRSRYSANYPVEAGTKNILSLEIICVI